MVLPGPRSFTSRTAPAMLIAGGAAEAKTLMLEQVEHDRDGLLVGNEIGLLAV